jgi:hypothetical protein
MDLLCRFCVGKSGFFFWPIHRTAPINCQMPVDRYWKFGQTKDTTANLLWSRQYRHPILPHAAQSMDGRNPRHNQLGGPWSKSLVPQTAPQFLDQNVPSASTTRPDNVPLWQKIHPHMPGMFHIARNPRPHAECHPGLPDKSNSYPPCEDNLPNWTRSPISRN